MKKFYQIVDIRDRKGFTEEYTEWQGFDFEEAKSKRKLQN